MFGGRGGEQYHISDRLRENTNINHTENEMMQQKQTRC